MRIEPRLPVIVVGVDGSGESLVAAHWAAQEARRRQLALMMVHGFTEPIIGAVGAAEVADAAPPQPTRHCAEAAQRVLDGAAQAIATNFPDVEFNAQLVAADPGWAVVNASEHAQLTVVGHRGHGHVNGVLIGSVAQFLAAQGGSPVAVIPPGASLDDSHSDDLILLGVDETDSCEAAISYAFDEAARSGSEVVAALVVNDTAVPAFVRGLARVGSLQDEQEQELLAGQLDGWSEKYPLVAVQKVVLRGHPADAILEYGLGLPAGHRPRMIVVGSHGRGVMSSMLLGSTSRSLISRSVWPVVVVRPGCA